MEQKEDNSIFIPSESKLILPYEEKRENDFDSKFLNDEILTKNSKQDKDNNKLMKELEDILVCCICYNYLDNPVNDPSCCPHYACKNCLEKYFKQRKSNIIPCPLCRKYIKKQNLIKIPIIESIKEIIKEAENFKKSEEINLEIKEMCEEHPKNKVFSICLECKKKCAQFLMQKKKFTKIIML